jgi:signal peptidase I
MPDGRIFAVVLEQALTTGATVRFRAEGESMYPTIRHGETISMERVSTASVIAGDVLLCRHGTRLLAHRVVHIAADGASRGFQLRGDAKGGCDAPIGASAVVGRVVSVDRNGRVIPLCGRAARLRHTVRAMASRGRASLAGGANAYCRRVVRVRE